MYEIELYASTGPIHARPSPPATSTTVNAATDAARTVIVCATHSHNKATDAEGWHQRLGHPSYNIVEQMHRKNVVDRLEVTTFKRQPRQCEDCIMGKQTRHPLNGNSRPVTEVLE